MKTLLSLVALVLILIVPEIVVIAAVEPAGSASASEKGPPLDIIYLDVRSSQDVGIGDVATGQTDVFLWPASETVYKRLPLGIIQSLSLIRTASGYWSLLFNPVQDSPTLPGVVTTTGGAVHFNPFALREVRYQANWLINRKEKIIENILSNGGTPMYSPVQPSEPANRFVENVYTDLGLTSTGDYENALKRIDWALGNASQTLATQGYTLYKKVEASSPAGYWWTFAAPSSAEETVTVAFYIRIEDERLEEGRHIADEIEKAGIKADRLERDRRTCILNAYYTDPKDYLWNIYTEGWVAMAEWLYPEWNIAQMYAPWYTFMPGWGEGSWWQYQNTTIDEFTQKLIYGPVTSSDEYWNLASNILKMGIQESVRIFTAETWQYFPVNSRVSNIAYGTVSGLWPAWSLRTATTPDRVLRATEFSSAGVLFMSPWNTIGGFQDVYSELVWRYIRDYADYPHPQTGEPIPVRTTQDVTVNNSTNANIDIPNSAMVYDAQSNSWKTVGSGKRAKARVVLNYIFSNWHHGKMMTLADVLNQWGFMWEWATEDYPGDPYYNTKYASSTAPTLEQIGGIEIINSTTIAVYGNYTHSVSSAVTADFYAQWPTIPWEVLAAMEYVVINNGPVSGKAYGWYQVEGVEWIDMTVPSHVSDIKQAMNILKTQGYISNYAKIPEFSPSAGAAEERYTAAIDWTNLYNHVAISNGPYYLKSYDPTIMFMELRAFRDSTYPFGPSHWQAQLFLSKISVERVDAPTESIIGESIPISIYPVLRVEFPTPTEEPASSGYIEVSLRDPQGAVVYNSSANFVLPGLFSVTVPSNVTQSFVSGIYSLVVSAAVEKGLYPEVTTIPIQISKPLYSLTIGVFPFDAGQTSPGVGTTTYERGLNVTVTAIPAEGYKFEYWSLDGVPYSTQPTITVTMNQARRLVAYLTVSPVSPMISLEVLSILLSTVALVGVAITVVVFVVLPRRIRG